MKDEYIPVKTYKKWSLEIDKEPKNVIHTFGQIFYLGIKSTSAETNRLFFELDISKCTVKSFTNGNGKTQYKLYVEVNGKEQVEALENIFKDLIDIVIKNQSKIPFRAQNPRISKIDYLKHLFNPFLRNKVIDPENNIYRCSLSLSLNSNSEVLIAQIRDETTSYHQIDYTIINASVIFDLENIFVNSVMATCQGKVKTCLILNDIRNNEQEIDISESSKIKYLYEIQTIPVV